MLFPNYSQLPINKKIYLKGVFESNPEFQNYKLVMYTFGYREAIEYFITDDISILTSPMNNDFEKYVDNFFNNI